MLVAKPGNKELALNVKCVAQLYVKKYRFRDIYKSIYG